MDRPFVPFYHDVKLDDRIWWGKYKGLLLYQIIEKNTGYVNWCIENIENFHLNCEAFDYLITMENSAYNHKPIGEKPPIPNALYKELLERVAIGDFTLNAHVKATYSLDTTQKNLLNTLLQLAKTKLFQDVTVTLSDPSRSPEPNKPH